MDDKTIRILNLISEKKGLTQRDIASHSDLSLGLVNLILKRLINTGHVKIANLNRKKVNYFLTPKGFMERANYSFSYILKTLKISLEYQKRISAIVDELVKDGHTSFCILGEGDIADLVEIALNNYPTKVAHRRISPEMATTDTDMIFDCRMNGKEGARIGINVLSTLLNGGLK